jgi:hypothetical protein
MKKNRVPDRMYTIFPEAHVGWAWVFTLRVGEKWQVGLAGTSTKAGFYCGGASLPNKVAHLPHAVNTLKSVNLKTPNTTN